MSIKDHRGEIERPVRSPLKAIRKFCLACMGGSSAEVEGCTAGPDSSVPCQLWSYRFGKKLWESRQQDLPRDVSKGLLQRRSDTIVPEVGREYGSD